MKLRSELLLYVCLAGTPSGDRLMTTQLQHDIQYRQYQVLQISPDTRRDIARDDAHQYAHLMKIIEEPYRILEDTTGGDAPVSHQNEDPVVGLMQKWSTISTICMMTIARTTLALGFLVYSFRPEEESYIHKIREEAKKKGNRRKRR